MLRQSTRTFLPVVSLGALVIISQPAHAQLAPGGPNDAPPGVLPGVKMGGSSNIHLVAHIPMGGFFRAEDDEIEQDPDRPYAYVSTGRERAGFSIIDLRDLNNVHILYNWRIENVALHAGMGGMDGKYFKIDGPCEASENKHVKHTSGPSCAHYYYVQSLQFSQGTPDADLGAVVADVTGLPDTTKVKIVNRIRIPDHPGGIHNTFAYKHSDGHVYLFTTTNSPTVWVWDMNKMVLGGDPMQAKVGEVPVPEAESQRVGRSGYHDFYVGYDPATHQDKYYGAGAGGYYVYDVTNIHEPKLITSITATAGVTRGHTFTPDPTGRYVITESEYQYAPLRVFDLKPGLDGKVQTVNRPIGAWTADWHDLSHNHEVRWPFVFVSGYEDGLQVFSMYDPTHPTTVGWYYTCQCAHETGFGGLPNFTGTSVEGGAFGIDVRNRDGLIMISDMDSGVWFFKMDGFSGWNGHDWGVPNISSVQDYDHGPEGATAPAARPAASP